MSHLNLKNFALPKQESDPNLWADHIELLCLLQNDSGLSAQDVIDRVLDENSNEPKAAAKELLEEDEFDEMESSFQNSGMDSEEVEDESRDEPAIKDKIASKISELFSLLSSRATHFSDAYPFIVVRNNIKPKSNLDALQNLYLILLVSSLLKLATKNGVNVLGHQFEFLCGPVFKKLLPPHSASHFFGAGGSKLKSPFKGTFYDKILKLCEALHLHPRTNFTEESAGHHNVGDGGLDWVGFYNFKDNKSFQPIFFGQCACGSNWIDKEFDAHASKWSKLIQFECRYLTYHFIPRSYRDESLGWYNSTKIYDNIILIDRYRLISLIDKEEDLADIIEHYKALINEVKTTKLDQFS